MTIRFREQGEPRRERISILTVPPIRRVRFLGLPHDHIQVYLHWSDGYSVPCLGDECDLCADPPILMGYAAVANYIKPREGPYVQVPAILPVTENALAVLESDQTNLIFEVSRHNGLANGRLVLKIQHPINDTTLPLFDVKEKLIALWATRQRIKPKKKSEKDAKSFLY